MLIECNHCHKKFQGRSNRRYCTNACYLVYLHRRSALYKITPYSIKQGNRYKIRAWGEAYTKCQDFGWWADHETCRWVATYYIKHNPWWLGE